MAKKTIKATSEKIGQAIARSTHKIESAGKKAQNTVEDAAQTVTLKAKGFMEALQEGTSRNKEKQDTSGPSCPFRINAENSIEGQIGETAGVVYEYLCQNSRVPTTRLVNAVMRKKHTQANVYAALGWLMREAKLNFTEEGTMVELRK